MSLKNLSCSFTDHLKYKLVKKQFAEFLLSFLYTLNKVKGFFFAFSLALQMFVRFLHRVLKKKLVLDFFYHFSQEIQLKD